MADHITEARQRVRLMLSGESHLGAVDDWRRALVSARDALILVWLTWIALHDFGEPAFTGYLLVALALALALLLGISTGRSTHAQLLYHAAELDRERAEIRDNRPHEIAEVRELYAAKGFRDPLLTQIVDTLAADDDRLLKVMMDEELGLSMYHMHHPLIVGLWNFGAAALAGLALALPVMFADPEFALWWMPGCGSVCLVVISVISARSTGRSAIEFFAVGVVMAVLTGGVVHTLSQWLAGFVPGIVTP